MKCCASLAQHEKMNTERHVELSQEMTRLRESVRGLKAAFYLIFLFMLLVGFFIAILSSPASGCLVSALAIIGSIMNYLDIITHVTKVFAKLIGNS